MTFTKRGVAQGILMGAGMLMVIVLFEALGWKMALTFLIVLAGIVAVSWATTFLIVDEFDKNLEKKP